jgi:hypothetical protein
MMMTPPNNKLGGPPPGTFRPGMTSMNGNAMEEAAEGESKPQGGGGGLAKTFYAIEQQLETLASSLPEQVEEIDEIKTMLRGVLAKAIPSGASGPRSLTSSPMGQETETF